MRSVCRGWRKTVLKKCDIGQIYIPRRCAGKAPELSREMRLIGEAARDGDVSGGPAALQMSQRPLKPHGACERLGRKTDGIEVLTLQLPRT